MLEQLHKSISIRTLPFALILSWFGCSVASAGLLLRLEDTTMIPGNLATVNVFVSSDANDTITDASFEFRITPIGATPRQLLFTDPQSDPQLNDPAYLFADASLKRDGDVFFMTPPSSVGQVSSVSRPNDTFIGFDLDPMLTGVPLGTDEFLLAVLEFEPDAGLLAPIAGDQFQVQLISGGSSFFLDLTNTTDPNITFTSTPATITVAAVPEPSTLATWSLLFAAVGGRRRSRPRSDQNR